MKIIEKFLTKNPCYTCGRTITPKGLMLHSVGCSQPSAMVFINQWNPPANGREVCVHGFIDGNTGDVYQTLPWNRRGWHAGGSANNTHIGVEMCEPSCIKYTSGSSFTCSDIATAKAVAKRTYDAAVELFAFLCKKYGLDPTADGVIVSHKEGHARGVASNHGDPEHLWKGLNTGYTMAGFRKAVKAAMSDAGKKEKTKTSTSKELKVGDTVTFTGSKHYKNATEATGSACKPGKAKITAIAKGKKHPYHLVRVSESGATVYGWVNEADIKEAKATNQKWTPEVGDVVKFTGNKHYKNATEATGSACKPGKAKITAIAKGKKHPYHLVRVSGSGATVYGWVDAGTFTKA